ncbi:MAG: DEAD/DEAH box helicase, partial [Campylobacterota bacterium]|nr:DEAD/DEAH box helicase [Campylobacterota bacterium]
LFTSFGLSKPIQKALTANQYHTPTPIQSKVIPLILDKKDIMAQAQTGSGKSAGFVLPLLEMWSHSISEGKAKIKILVLTPTRELTLQVAETFMTFGIYIGDSTHPNTRRPKVVSVIGGESIGDQLYAIQHGRDILVATSGRFVDILRKKQINLSHIEYLVLDEADKMLNLGFAEELDLILKALPTKRQNLLFSATYPPKMLTIASRITTNALEVSVESQRPTVAQIVQRVIEVNPQNRGPLLRYLLKKEKWKQVLVFMSSKRATDNIAEKFRKRGYLADSFHGDLHQDDRNYTLEQFKSKKLQILFTTDLLSRGLDIEGVDCVVNYDLPRSPADYIHRIGRTGRAGNAGLSISFIGHEEQDHFRLIEKRSQIKLTREEIAGFELTGDAPIKARGKAPIKGKRNSKKDKLREKAAREAT